MSDNKADTGVLFSLVIPSYNRAHLVAKTLESVFNQEEPDFEVIFVDDGSTDNTADVLKQFDDPRIRYIRIENSERGKARNTGILASRGKYVSFCDSDDLLYPIYFSRARKMIEQYGDLPWFHLSYEIRRHRGPAIAMRLKSDKILETLSKGNPLSCMGVFVRRDFLLSNLFNEDRQLSGSEDWELWLRLGSRFKPQSDPVISSALIVHDERSVVQTSELKLQLRKYLSIGYAFDDEHVQKQFGPYREQMYAYFDSYISLHLALAGKNRRSLRYLLKAVRAWWPSLFERRTLATFKYIFLNIS